MKRWFLYEQSGYCVAAMLHERMLERLVVEPQRSTADGNAARFYKATITEVVPAFDAIFLDAGLGRNVFLKISDLLPSPFCPAHQITSGQTVMVQLLQTATADKGARVTTKYKLVSDYFIYLPHADYVTCAQMIASAEKTRLLAFTEKHCLPQEGWVIRSRATLANEAQLHEDMESLRMRWHQVGQAYSDHEQTVGMVEDGLSAWERVCQRMPSEAASAIWIDDSADQSDVYQALERQRSDWLPVIQRDRLTMQEMRHQLRPQFEKLSREKIWLPSGGYLVIQQTAALLAVDVNVGKSIDETDFSNTVMRTNTEAAEWIARVLRLRSLGGCIVIDFVHVKAEEQRIQILEVLQSACALDEEKIHIGGWTHFGLVELSRKKTATYSLAQLAPMTTIQ